jgi:DNA repair protein RadD
MPLRDYQEYAVQSIYAYFEAGNKGNPVVAMPTGTGKSHVISGFIYGLFAQWPTQRVMMLTHVKELIEQNAKKLEEAWPFAPMGIYSAGLKAKQAGYPITFAGIQSCAKAAALFGHIDIILIDECHLVSPNQNTSYQKFIADLKIINPALKVVGLSATPYRLGLGMITEGGIFTDICCDMTTMESFNWFVDEGYLAPLIPKPTETKIDLDGVGKRGGEFIDKHLQNAVDKDEITEAALRETLEVAQGRLSGLVFATGVDHAEHIVDMLHILGETAVCVHSKLTPAQRTDALHAHQTGEARWIVNNNVLTTGYDDPRIDCIVMLRPTNSPGLWVQMLGRGTRPNYETGFDLQTTTGRLEAIAASDKQNCLVLDFAGNTMRLGPVNDPVIPSKKGKGGGEPPVKICEQQRLHQRIPENWGDLKEDQQREFREWYEHMRQPDGAYKVSGCSVYNHPVLKNCVNCGAEFIFQPKITTTASNTELIRRKKKTKEGDEPPVVEVFRVDKIVYSEHTKPDKPSSIKVKYHCGLRQFTEWVPAWHESGIKHKGRAWWEQRSDLPLPDNAEEAIEMSDDIKQPTHIRVWLNKKYPEVMGCLFDWKEEDNDTDEE